MGALDGRRVHGDFASTATDTTRCVMSVPAERLSKLEFLTLITLAPALTITVAASYQIDYLHDGLSPFSLARHQLG